MIIKYFRIIATSIVTFTFIILGYALFISTSGTSAASAQTGTFANLSSNPPIVSQSLYTSENRRLAGETRIYLPIISFPAPPAAPVVATAFVDVNDFEFSPRLITIKAGDTIVWRFKGRYIHAVTANDDSYKSSDLKTNATYKHSFDQPGIFQYYCYLHGNKRGTGMSARIVVEQNDRVAVQPGQPQPVPPAQPLPTEPPAPTAPPAAAGTVLISMQDFAFGPQVVTIKTGDTVRWTHVGEFPHTVKADNQAWGSDTLNTGEIYEQTFATPGVYAYYCTLHGSAGGVGMTGVIQVQDPSGAPLPTVVPTAIPSPVPTAPPAAAGTTIVQMQDFSFGPSVVTIKTGDKVRWANVGKFPHTATADNQGWGSAQLTSGQIFERTFTAPGSYAYYCTLHGSAGGTGMAGIIQVQDPGGAPLPTLTPTLIPSPAPTSAPPPPAPVGTLDVAVQDDQFIPKTVTINAGSSIRWINNGQSAHTISASNQAWDSGRLNSGGTFQHTFSAPGTYQYYCAYHGSAGGSGMAGTIIVQDVGAPLPTPAPTSAVQPPTGGTLTATLTGSAAFPSATGSATYENRDGELRFRLELRAGVSYQTTSVDVIIDGIKIAQATLNDKGECRLDLRSSDGDSLPGIRPGAKLVMQLQNGTLLATGTF